MLYLLRPEHYDYLIKNYHGTPVIGNFKGGYYLIEASDELALEICEWTEDEIQMGGFDREGRLTRKGELVEDIYDVFSVPIREGRI
ncbi:MAG: hypothetical protein LIP08_00325 [Bacteroides sp.]|nr:hypothetical protein [Bacteroides sp.]